MDIAEIDKAFETMINQRGIYHKLEESANYVQQLRHKLKNDIGISTDTKLRLLQKSGWRQEARTFSKQDMFDFAKFYHKTSQAARDQGFAYVLEKWEAKRG